MAKTRGALHSDLAVGTADGITHRVYRGMGVVSSKRIIKARHQVTPKLTSPQDIESCFARYNLGQGVTLTPPPDTQYVISIEDLVGGIGQLANPIAGDQPRFYPSDPLHNDRPYCYFDGVTDRMRTDPLTTPLPQPFEVWTVQSGLLISTAARRPFLGFDPDGNGRFASTTLGTDGHAVWMSVQRKVSEAHDVTIFLNRLVVERHNCFCEWNGIQQMPPGDAGFGDLVRLMVAHRWTGDYCRFNLFEICIFRSILKPTERQLLTNWYLEWFSLP